MKDKSKVLKVGDTVIFYVDEWGNGKKEVFDGNIVYISPKGYDILYLSGYRSRNDLVQAEDIIAKLDMTKPVIKVADGTFNGHFDTFED